VPPTHVRRDRDGWTVWVDPAGWRDAWWETIQRCVRGYQPPLAASRHARTFRLDLPADELRLAAYLKAYHRAGWRTQLKDYFRASKALRALSISDRLARDDFRVPRVLAAAERRRCGRLVEAFLLTEAAPGMTLRDAATYLQALPAVERRRRREMLAVLGAEIGRLHRLGYVHGDLLVTNVMIDLGPPLRVVLLDHDRSRRPRRARARAQERNLIQLNRIEMPGVRHTDRLRVFRAYAAARGWSAARAGAIARRVARGTVRRREELAHLAAHKTRRGRYRVIARGPAWRDAYVAALAAADEILARSDAHLLKHPYAGRTVGLVTIDGEQLVVKRFEEYGPLDRVERWVTGSAAERAARGIARVRAAGLAAPDLVAVLATDRWRNECRSLLVTRALVGAEPADRVWQSLRGRARFAFARALAAYVRELHARGLYPQDVWARNFLVRRPAGGFEIVLVDLDRVRAYRRLAWRRRMKNLVQLHRSFGRSARTAEQVCFLRAYLGAVPDDELRAVGRAILAASRRKDAAWERKHGASGLAAELWGRR
jgi:tRNA A-37 threonylcarbamoyl transferase component Bud32